MSDYKQIKINNSKSHAIKSKWKEPGAAFYDQLLNAFYCDGGVPAGSKELAESIKSGKYKQWPDFLKEAYLIAPVEDIKNSPYGITPYSRSGCKYPHHVIRDGELVLSIQGLKHAYEIAWKHNDLNANTNRHINRHLKELGLRPQFHHGVICWFTESDSDLRIEENFKSIERYIFENTGIDLHCPTTIYEEDIDNGVIRPLMRDDVTNPYFVNWLFRSYEFCDDDPEKFDYDLLVNNDAMGNYVYGYFVEDNLEGIIKVKYRKPEDYYAISMLFVNDQNESKGIGQALMKYVINKYGDKEMRLNVFEFNSRAMHIYKKYGFDVAASDVAKPEADGDTNKLVGQKFYKMVRRPTEYDPPLSFDKLPDHLKSDPVHAWRAKTGIELIHKEPSLEELNRIWANWNKMPDEKKRISDQKSMELFGKNNHDHYVELVGEYSKTNDKPAIAEFPSGYFSEDDTYNEIMDMSIDTEDIFDEASHGKLKYDFRMGWDYNTGHMIKIVYSLENINVTDVGDFYYNYDGKKTGATHDSHLKYTRDNIRKKGNTDHQSTGQKVLAIIDTVTNTRLQEVKLLNPFCSHINIRSTTQPRENLEKSRAAADANPNFLSHVKVGEIDKGKTYKSTHWATRIMDKDSGENLRFNKISKSETLRAGRGWKVNNIDAKDFPVYGDPNKYMIYHNPNKKQALNELFMREQDILNYFKFNKDDPDFKNSSSYKAEVHNLRIIQRDIDRIENGSYDLSIMKKYRESDEGRLAGLSGNQLLEYNTYLDFRPASSTIERGSSLDILHEIKQCYSEGGTNMDDEDDLSWITAYLMEDVEPKKDPHNEKYKIIHRKSKYKGWDEYIIYAEDGKEAASCIINPKTGDCADVETKPEYRRQGYMQYLLKYLVKFKGVKYAQVRQDNSIAISLYHKIGFEVEFKYTDKEKGPMYSMSFQGDTSKLIVEGYDFFTESEEPPSIVDDEPIATEESKEEPKKESMPKKTDKAESSKNGVRRKKLYIAFIEWCKEYNNKNTFGSIFDKDAFNVSYPFVPEEMRYFYRLANPMLCVLGGELTFFPVAELRKLNSKNSHLAEMMIFAATPTDVRVFNSKDKKVYRGTEENGTLKLNEVLGDTFDTYIQKMINKGDILNGPIEEYVEFEE